MDYILKAVDYQRLVYDTASLIKTELHRTKLDTTLKRKDVSLIYARGVIMLEFFRFLRGEAFIENEVRPPTPGYQDHFYKIEDDIKNKLQELKKIANIDFEKVDEYLKQVSNSWVK